MSQMSKKLVLSVLAVVLTVVALGTTTFAWFTLTNVAQVQSFQAEVIADSGMEISLDDTANANVWVTSLTTAMIQDYIETKYSGNFKFDANTTADGEEFFPLGASVASSAGVLEIGLRFRSQTVNTINWTSVSLDSAGVGFIPGVSFLNTSGSITAQATSAGTFKASNAARIAVDGTSQVVYELGGNAPGTSVGTTASNTHLGAQTGVDYSGYLATIELDGINVNAIKLPDSNPLNDGTSLGDTFVYLYDGDEYALDFGTTDYVAYATEMGVGEVADYTFPALYAGQLAYYYETTNEFPAGVDDINTVATVTTLGGGLEVLSMSADNLGTGYTFSDGVTIRIWIEGWDPDMFNAILEDIITASFTFTGSVV